MNMMHTPCSVHSEINNQFDTVSTVARGMWANSRLFASLGMEVTGPFDLAV